MKMISGLHGKGVSGLRMTRTLVCLSLSPMLLWCFAQRAEAKAFSVSVPSAILVNTSTGHILYEQNADQLIPPASVTKILTLYLVYEAIEAGKIHLGDKVRISKNAARMGGSKMFLKAGTRVTVEQLIKGTAVVSGNDAAVALAEHVGGSVPNFVKQMNRKATQLGMSRSRFKNPNGLPAAGQFTTARDMTRLSLAYLQRFPNTLNIHSMRCYTYQGRTQPNRNRLLGSCAGVDGIKTGFVRAAGYNLVATAKRGNTRLMAVVLGARSAAVRNRETTRLIEAGFNGMKDLYPSQIQPSHQVSKKKAKPTARRTQTTRQVKTAGKVR